MGIVLAPKRATRRGDMYITALARSPASARRGLRKEKTQVKIIIETLDGK